MFALSEKELDYLCNGMSEISKVYNAMKVHCLQAMRILPDHANGRFDWLISEHYRVNFSRKQISFNFGKYIRITFVHLVEPTMQFISCDSIKKFARWCMIAVKVIQCQKPSSRNS